MRKRRRLVALALCVASAVLVALALDAAGGLTGLRAFEDFTLDLRQQATPESFQPGRGARESDVVLVLFDDYSVMDTVDGWDWISPFPRAHLADLVDALSAAGARTIGLDVYLDRLWDGLNAIDRGDERLRDAIQQAGNVILATPVERTDSGPVMSPPHRYFAEVAAGIGSAELPSSFESFRDGTLAVRSGYGIEPSFALALYAHARGLAVDSILRDAVAEGRLSLPGLPRSVGRIPPEWLHDDESGKLTVFILDGAAKEMAPIAAEHVTIEKKIGDKVDRYQLPAVDRTESTPKVAKFEIVDKPLIEALKTAGQGVEAKLTVDIDGKAFTGQFEHHDHADGHGHKH